MNTASSSGTGSLPSNTIPNPQEDLKAITTQSGVTLAGPSVSPPPPSKPSPASIFSTPISSSKMPKVRKDTVQLSIKHPTSDGPNLSFVDYVVDPRVPLILGRPFLRTERALIDVYGEELSLCINDEAITFKVGQTSKYSYNDAESINQIDVFDVACEEYVQEVLGFSDKSKSDNLTPTLDLIISSSSPSFTPFERSDFILEEIETFLRTPDDFSNLDDDYYDIEGDILYLAKLLNEDPSLNIPPVKTEDLKQVDATITKPSIDEPPELELKELPCHLEYAFLEGTDKLPVIISKELKDEEKASLLKVLKSHKRAITWKIFDIKGIDHRFCTHKILMEDDFKPMVQHQRRVNPKIHEVIKKDVIKLLDAGLIYPIFDSLWVSPVHCMPKKCVLSKTIVYTGHSALKYLLAKHDAKLILIRWILLLQEFDVIIRDKKGAENLTANHLSRLENPHQDELKNKEITETFPLESLEAKALPTNDARVVVKFLKSLFARFGTPRAIISDRDTHFCNDQFAKVMLKYGVTHRLSTAYHPQTSGQVEVSNRGLKCILERTIGENRASWSDKLYDALWAFCTAFKTPIGSTPYNLVYEKACHLPIELEHKAYWALKHCNFDLKTAEKTKKIHDSKIKNHVFNVGDRVLLFNSSLKIFSGKLKTRRTGPFTVAHIFPYGTIELSQADGPNFKVTNMSKVDKIKAKQTKPGTGMKRVQEIEAEDEFISNLILLIH
nr:reverse transcriptase domain-containing protein [Tanacetum cinerariifolium]